MIAVADNYRGRLERSDMSSWPRMRYSYAKLPYAPVLSLPCWSCQFINAHKQLRVRMNNRVKRSN